MVIGDFVKGTPGSPYCITTDHMTKAIVTDVNGDKITVRIIDHDYEATGLYEVENKYFEVIGHAKPFDREAVLELLINGFKNALFAYDLSGADLSGFDLRGFDLRGANLSEADLREADLREADLREADLREADLRGADLREADLREADLRGANLREADLSEANLDFSCWQLWCGSLRVKADKRLAAQIAYHLCSIQCDDTEYIAMRNSILDFANQFHRVHECGKLEPIEIQEAI